LSDDIDDNLRRFIYYKIKMNLLMTKYGSTVISFAVKEEQIEKIKEVAAMIHASNSAAIRSLIEAGYEHMQER